MEKKAWKITKMSVLAMMTMMLLLMIIVMTTMMMKFIYSVHVHFISALSNSTMNSKIYEKGYFCHVNWSRLFVVDFICSKWIESAELTIRKVSKSKNNILIKTSLCVFSKIAWCSVHYFLFGLNRSLRFFFFLNLSHKHFRVRLMIQRK